MSFPRLHRHTSAALVAGAAVAMLMGCSSEVVEVSPALTGDRLAFRTVPAQVVSGAAIDPAVQVVILRQDGGIDASSTASVTLTAQSAVSDALRGTTTVTALAGIATFPGVTLTRASSATKLFARANGLTGAESAPLTVVHGAPAQLVFLTQPTAATAGQTLSALRIELRDGGGNRVLSANGAITVAIATGPPGASITGTATVDLASGEAVLTDLRLPRAGNGYSLTASLVGNADVRASVTRVFAITPALPAELAFLVEPTPSIADAPIAPSIRVAIVDRFGNVVPTATNTVALDLAVAPVGTQLRGTTTVASSEGVALFADVRVDRATTGARLRATAAGLVPSISAIFPVGAP